MPKRLIKKVEKLGKWSANALINSIDLSAMAASVTQQHSYLTCPVLFPKL